VKDLEHARKIRDALEMRYHQERIGLRIPRTTVEVIEPAKPPDREDYVSPDFMLNLVLSIMVGLGFGVGLAYFIEYLDTSVKTIEDVERYMRVPVMGVIPQKVRPLVDETAEGAHAEAYRVLRTNMQFSKKVKGGKTFCVTSGSVGEGKSLTIFNLAYVCAQLGDRVLIVDSDLHRPRQHRILGVSNARGLANILVGEAPLDEVIVKTQVSNLEFLPSGKLSSGVHGLLDTQKMKQLVATLKERYDYVFFDAPPIIGVSDASLLVGEMDGVLLVVQHRKYPRSVSNRAKDMVENVGGNLLGVVLNNINISRDYSYYYHYYYYRYPQHGKTARS
jgi:capsular exopolysaccharide synthesis family protein